MKTKHTFNYIAGSASQALFPFFLYPFLTRFLDKNVFGNLITAISVVTVLSYLFSLGLPAIISRQLIFDKKNSEILKKYFNERSKLILLSILFLNLLIVFIPIENSMKTFIYIISGSFFLSFSQIKLAIYRSEYKSLLFVVLAISSNGVPLLVTTFISRFTNLEPISIYFFTLYLSVIIFTQPFRYSSFNQQISLKPLIQSSYPMIAHGIAISLFQYGDKIAGYFGSNSLVAAEIAILSLILTGPVLLLNTLNNVWLPTSLESYKKRKSVGISNSNQIANKIAFLISLIIIVLLLLIDKISIFYISRTYDYYSIEKTIIGSLFITPLYVMYLQNSHLITVKKNFQILGIITPITSAVQFFLTYIFVNSIGLIAVGYGFIAGITLQVLLTTIFTKNAKNLGLNPIFYSLALGVFSYFLYAFRF